MSGLSPERLAADDRCKREAVAFAQWCLAHGAAPTAETFDAWLAQLGH